MGSSLLLAGSELRNHPATFLHHVGGRLWECAYPKWGSWVMVGLFLRSLSTAFHSSCTTSLFLTVATCSFEFTFSCLGMLSNFLHTCWSFIYMPLEKLSFQSGGFLLLSCRSFINIGLLLLIQIMICKYFLPCFAFFPLLLCSLTV